jgi:hypothetical protein
MITPIATITPGLFEISEKVALQLDAAGQQVYQRTNLLKYVNYFAIATCPTCGKPTDKPGAMCLVCLPIK